MKVSYYPAARPDTVRARPDLHPLHWLDSRTRRAGAFHPYVLASAALWHREAVPRRGVVFGDSGGFQVLSRGADLDPRSVLTWQLRHADHGPVLDIPPCGESGQAPKDPQARFTHCLRLTEANLYAALPLYAEAREAGTRFRLWGVIHGASWDQLAAWHARIGSLYSFDGEGEGWCTRPDPAGSPAAVARVLAFARSRGLRWLHVFVPGGPPAVATLLVLARAAGVASVSWDNSSPITSGFNHRTLYRRRPNGLAWRTLTTTEGRDRFVRDWMLARCPCASCRWMAGDLLAGSRQAQAEGYLRRRIAFHNLLAAVEVYANLKRAARRDPWALLDKVLGPDRARKVRAVFVEEGGQG